MSFHRLQVKVTVEEGWEERDGGMHLVVLGVGASFLRRTLHSTTLGMRTLLEGQQRWTSIRLHSFLESWDSLFSFSPLLL